jgi:DNA-directed RNA polymerase II subunit RPB1
MQALRSYKQLGIEKAVAVKRVKFGIVSPQDVVDNSVCAIDNITSRGNLRGTLSDPRLYENGGGFGHIELQLPVYNPLFISDVHHILKCVCLHCSSIRVKTREDYEQLCTMALKKPVASRIDFVDKRVAKNFGLCVFCQNTLHKVTKDPNQNLGFQYEEDKSEFPPTPLYSHETLAILERISDYDVSVMGFDPKWSRPDWMIIQMLPVLPPQCRPAVMTDEGRISDDDLTQSIHNIIKWNRCLLAAIEAAKAKAESPSEDFLKEPNVRGSFKCLQLHVAALIDNDTKLYDTVCNRGQRKLNSISCLHKGKYGRWRLHVFGKRCESTARAVIGGNPQLSMTEIGIPLYFARSLTVEEVVNVANQASLRAMVVNGPTKYPGANEIQLPGDTFKRNLAAFTEEQRMAMALPFGTVVFRHLVDGDVVISNRQPTLHKMSMMAHYIRVFDTDNIQHNINNTPPYGADFDGDEMNIIVPKKYASRVEVAMLCLTATQMVSPQAAKNIIGAVQDSQYGAYMVSKEQHRFSHVDFMHLSSVLGKQTGNTLGSPTVKGWTGRDLVNEMLPPVTMNLGNVKVDKGVMMSGELTSQHLSKGSHGGLVYLAWINNCRSAAIMMDDFSRMSHEYFLRNPATVSLNDCLIEDIHMTEVKRIKANYLTKVEKLLHGYYNRYYHKVRMELELGDMGVFSNDRERFEADISFLLTKLYTECLAVAQKHIDKDAEDHVFQNGLLNMIKAGSKGNTTNLAQISTLLGPQHYADTGRAKDFLPGHRSIPMHPKGDIGPNAKGMVLSSFEEGLDTSEQFFHAMAGREGLINTAIKTADTGYMQRKLVESMKNLLTALDGTVRLANNTIVQFIYGGDGINGTHVQRQRLPLLYLSKAKFTKAVYYPRCKALVGACVDAWESLRKNIHVRLRAARVHNLSS